MLMMIKSVCSKRKIHYGLVIFNINWGLQTFCIDREREKVEHRPSNYPQFLTPHNHGYKGKGEGWCYQLLIERTNVKKTLMLMTMIIQRRWQMLMPVCGKWERQQGRSCHWHCTAPQLSFPPSRYRHQSSSKILTSLFCPYVSLTLSLWEGEKGVKKIYRVFDHCN